MIDSARIERAERVLKVVYGGDIQRQLDSLRVERAAMENLIEHCNAVIAQRYSEARAEMDPRLDSAYNTMMTHMFLLGVTIGRAEE